MPAVFKFRPRGTLSRVAFWAVFGAGIGSSCAALYGALFGEAEIQIAGAAQRLLPLVGYFAVCGLIAGAIIGAVAGIVNGQVGNGSRPAGPYHKSKG